MRADCDFDNPSLTCPRCKFDVGKIGGAADWRRNCPLGTGLPAPGGQLQVLLQPLADELGIKPRSNCGCAAYARMMDSWGVAKCRERKAEIVDHLLGELQVTSTELPFGLDLRELLTMLVERAIDEAEAATADHPQAEPTT